MKSSISLVFIFILTAGKAFADSQIIRISAVGDVMMGTTYPTSMLPSDSGKSYFKAITPYLNSSDINFANFEGTFFSGEPQPDGKTPGPNRYLFQTPPSYVERLVEAKFNVVSLANNHAKDFGRAGLLSTKQTLKLASIQYSSKDGEVANFNIRGTTAALIAMDFQPGNRSITQPNSTLSEIESLKKKYSIVVVSAHVGAEGEQAEHAVNQLEIFLGENRGNSVAFAHSAIDAGADVIIMHGPHVPRGIEIYRNRVILYSLGNFATGTGINIHGIAGLAPLIQVDINLQGQFIQGQLTSLIQVRDEETQIDSQKRALSLIKSLSEQDFPQSTPHFQDNGLFTN